MGVGTGSVPQHIGGRSRSLRGVCLVTGPVGTRDKKHGCNNWTELLDFCGRSHAGGSVMSWIGLRDQKGGVFSPVGLGRMDRAPFDLNAVLPRGTVMFEFASDPRGGDQTLLDYGATHPWAAGLKLTLCADGTLSLTQWMGAQRRVYRVATNLLSVTPSITVSYTWDAPLRRGVLAVEAGGASAPILAELPSPLPLSIRDVMRLMSDRHHCRINSDARFLAIANDIMPICVLPKLGGATLIQTPKGALPVSKLRMGQMVTTATGDTAQVRWVGSAELPARGRFAPLMLRAPYHGLRHDMVVAPDQRLRARGPEVEYLFGTPHIAMRAGHLVDGVSVRAASSALVHRYWQVMLDRPASLAVDGLVFDGLDTSTIQADPALRAHTVLAHLPPELLPSFSRPAVPLLQSVEALTLRKLQAA